LIEKWERKIGVKVKQVRIKKMKTKWGTCNAKDKRVWLNLELAKQPHLDKILNFIVKKLK